MTALNSPKLDVYRVHISAIRQGTKLRWPLLLSCNYRHRHLPSDVDFRQLLYMYRKGFGAPRIWCMTENTRRSTAGRRPNSTDWISGLRGRVPLALNRRITQCLRFLPVCFGTALMIGKYSVSSPSLIGTTSALAQGLVLQLGGDAPISELPHGVDLWGRLVQKEAASQRDSKQTWIFC